MNVLIPYKWLKEIVNTDLDVNKASELITLRSSSVEKIEMVEGDSVMDIEITPNRGDNLSILGIAREFYAICKAEGVEAKFNNPLDSISSFTKPLGLDPSKGTNPLGENSKTLNISIQNNNINPRFTAIVIDNITIKESPEYIKQRLTQVGIRPINNIVDLTNYIMILTGQPMHAFDYNKINGAVMNVRESTKGEQIVTLDGVKRELPEGSIVINDSQKIIDLCGIMGGENSEIDNNTKTVVLFTQIYDKYKLRKTSLALNHRTEAVLRFEKGLDPLIQDKALFKALEVLKESTNYDVVSPLYDLNSTSVVEKEVEMSYQKLYKIANSKIQIDTCKNILEALGFTVLENNEQILKVKVPSYRIEDISIEEDLIEEIIRIYGYEKIGLLLPQNHFDLDIYNNTNKVERIIKNYLKAVGFNELLTISMVSENRVNKEKAVKIDNPLGRDMEYMRTSQEPILKEALQNNRGEVSVFELAKVYKKSSKELPVEYKKLAILSSTKNSDEQVLNVIRNIFKTLQIINYKLKIKNDKIVIYISKKLSGKILFRNNYSFAEILFKNLVKNYNDYPNIPQEYNTNVIVEDLTILTPLNSLYSEIERKILDNRGWNIDGNTMLKIEYKDSFNKENGRALTITLKYQNKEHNLGQEEVGEIRNRIIQFVEKNLGLSVSRV